MLKISVPDLHLVKMSRITVSHTDKINKQTNKHLSTVHYTTLYNNTVVYKLH